MTDNGIQVANYAIALNGTDLSDELMAAIEGVTLEEEINLPAMFTLKFNIVDFANGTWRGIDLNSFKPGDSVKIKMGMDTPKEMMTGEIAALDLTFGEHSLMEIRGFDKLFRLKFGTKRRSFKDMKDSDIASSIASESGLSAQVDDTSTVHPYLFQNNLSNYDFLLERAKRIGYELLNDDKTFIFRKSQEDKAPALTLEYGIDFDRFSIQLKTLAEGSAIEVKGWDIKKKSEITATATSGSETSIMGGQESGYQLSESSFSESPLAIVDEAVVDATDAENISKAHYNSLLKDFISGEGTCSGNADIRVGTTLEIKGIGDRFSGNYYVIAVTHSMDTQGYATTFKVRRTGI
jgi:phage protein D